MKTITIICTLSVNIILVVQSLDPPKETKNSAKEKYSSF